MVSCLSFVSPSNGAYSISKKKRCQSHVSGFEKKVKHFQRIYNELDNEHANMDEDILIQVALELYRFESDGREFTHRDA